MRPSTIWSSKWTFRPRGASRCLHAAVLLYAWDGQAFTDVFEKTE